MLLELDGVEELDATELDVSLALLEEDFAELLVMEFSEPSFPCFLLDEEMSSLMDEDESSESCEVTLLSLSPQAVKNVNDKIDENRNA